MNSVVTDSKSEGSHNLECGVFDYDRLLLMANQRVVTTFIFLYVLIVMLLLIANLRVVTTDVSVSTIQRLVATDGKSEGSHNKSKHIAKYE